MAQNKIFQSNIILLVLLFAVPSVFSQQAYVKIIAKSGDGISTILDKFSLQLTEYNISKFKELNKKKFDKNGGLIKEQSYALPIIIINNRKIRISKATGLTDKKIINDILEYNMKVEGKGVKKEAKHILWIPLHFTDNQETGKLKVNDKSEQKQAEKNKETRQIPVKKQQMKKNITESLFGPKFENVVVADDKLQSKVFYLVSGHGGPDPGAVGNKDGHELCEDEYSYDVILRLARNLISHSAIVHIIVQDSSDGIRDEAYLKSSSGEVLMNGDSMPYNQTERLQGEVDLINEVSGKYSDDYSQYSINIHLDSRQNQKRIDIFFYYQENNNESKSLANDMYETIKHKYDKNQPGRGYKGSVTTRNLFMLRNTYVPTVYIELGNIKNPADQIRFIDKNNRQAIANWLTDGIIRNVTNK